MAENSKIQWTHHTFNPWSGCSKVHAGCTHCYAEVNYSVKMRGVKWGPNGTRVKTANWSDPIKWNSAAECLQTFDCCNGDHSDACPQKNRPRVFCASLADVFEDWQGPILNHRGVTIAKEIGELGTITAQLTMNDLRQSLFALIDATPNLDWLLLTKRPENIRRMLVPYSLKKVAGHVSQNEGDGMRVIKRHNLWLGTSISDQATAEKFIPDLIACRELSPVLFLSAEPLLGPIRLADLDADWVIVGGESGPHARPCNAEWIDSLVTQCREAAVPCFVKQLGSNHWGESPECGFARVPLEDSKGGDWDEWPESWRVRQFPNVEGAAK